ncbi:extracellular catalytic domain type 1 short-chain-length polyhydroxyalkanoate depolymerase [Actinomycetospora chlora]
MSSMAEATRLVRQGRLLEATARLQEGLGGRTPTMPTAPRTPGPRARTSGRAPGTVTRGAARAAGGTLAYRLYVPTTLRPAAPLLVLLHGGTQDADAFAAATGSDEAAERAGVVVVAPEQSRSANAMGYWNWFRPGDQGRDAGEPALIAAATRDVAERYGTDRARTAVAGFSAGGAMAAVMAATHPDLFCGAGVHSGLPFRAAHDVGSAFAVMSTPPARVADGGPVPLIAVHGDDDRTVAVGNGEAVVRSALAGSGRVEHARTTGRAPGGRAWTRERWAEPGGRALAESWTVHGMGHAWSGGRAGGSYTDPGGPDALAVMLAFVGFTDDGPVG